MSPIQSAGRTVRKVRTQAWEVAHEYLRDAILSEEFKPGERLIEKAIADKLGMSQGPVREALARLGEQGLVTSGSSQGRYVTSVPLEAGRMIFEIRARVEPLAAHAALKHMQVADLEALGQNVETMRTVSSVAARLDADMAFHRRIYELADFAPLFSLWEQMESQMRRLRPLATSDVAYRVHKLILDGLRAGDEELVNAALEQHMQETWYLGAGGLDEHDVTS